MPDDPQRRPPAAVLSVRGTVITRSGLRRASVGAAQGVVLDRLADPPFVTRTLGDLLDRDRTTVEPRVRWVLPRLHLGPGRVHEIVLLPEWTERPDGGVVVTAEHEPGLDVEATLRLDCTARDDGRGGSAATCVLEIDWRLDLRVSVPRSLVTLVRPALDRAVEQVVDDIVDRTVRGIERG